MSLNLMLTAGIPLLASGWLGRFYEPLGPVSFWWLNAALAGGGALLALAIRPLSARLLEGHAELKGLEAERV